MMLLLSRFKLGAKLALLLGLSALAVVVSIGVAASLMYHRMLDDRIDKARGVTEAALSIAQGLEAQVSAKQMTHEQALAELSKAVHAIRFDHGTGYIVVQNLATDLIVLHGGRPDQDGKPSTTKDASGRLLNDVMREALKTSDEGVVSYLTVKPGETQVQPKISYIARFAPWDLVFSVGAYVGDLDAAYQASLQPLIAVGGGILAVTLLAAWLINRDIKGSLGRLKAAMDRLAKGDIAITVPGTDRRDEIGAMAKAVNVFKLNMVEAESLRGEQEAMKRKAEADKKTMMNTLADDFEGGVRASLDTLASAATEMRATSQGMSATAEETSARATTVAAAAEEASVNVQTVASATEELSSSVAEIGRQVTQSTKIAGEAVIEADRTNTTVQGLSAAAQKIGDVVKLISDIASQTNLLALNATIEAARAGDAGKGFAVVASEVKSLANQTAKATEEISAQVAAMQGATSDAVKAIKSIGGTIGAINEIATTIASAVEEQGAATQEIARNVQEAARGTSQVSSNIIGVNQAAGETGAAANQVLVSAEELAKQADMLRKDVDNFLASIRAA
jgi:methyl-accepting chemotaxis protein